MKRVQYPWASSTITLLLVSLLMAGCPKRPEIAETSPKAIGPQGAIATPAPPAPTPPTVSAVPPTVPPSEEKSPTEVTAEAQEPQAAPESKVQEAESAPAPGLTEPQTAQGPPQEGEAAPEVGAAPEPQTTETELRPEGPAPGRGLGGAPGSEGQVKRAEAEPPAEAVAPPAPIESMAPAPVAPGSVRPAPSAAPAPTTVAEAPKAPEMTVKDIFFEFDQAVIRDDAKKTLADNIEWLKANAGAKATIEGHCDERGSSEYNLALGERRARVARDFIVAAGIETNRISTISFGKERPFVLGHDESAWKWNRRGHFVLTTK